MIHIDELFPIGDILLQPDQDVQYEGVDTELGFIQMYPRETRSKDKDDFYYDYLTKITR